MAGNKDERRGSRVKDIDIHHMLNRLKVRIDLCEVNPMLGEPDLLADAHRMIYDLSNKLKFRKPYERDKTNGVTT